MAKVDIYGMNYNELVRAVKSGAVSAKQIQRAYTSQRTTARSRIRSLSRPGVSEQFGSQELPTLPAARDIKHNTSDLLHAFVDVNRFLSAARSTVSGLKYMREMELQVLQQYKLDFIDESNYGKWKEFYKWFTSSEYIKFYDSNDEEVAQVFEEGSNPAEWAQLFNEYMGGYNESPQRGET